MVNSDAAIKEIYGVNNEDKVICDKCSRSFFSEES